MPRTPRSFQPGLPLHLHQRRNDKSPCFLCVEDHGAYLHWLDEYARHYGNAIHAYVLMTNHVHLVLTPEDPLGPSLMMQAIGRKYVPLFNRKHARTGTLWEGRFKSHRVETDRYLLEVYRYVELNPVRAGMVDAPSQYRWSSYRANALGARDDRIRPHSLFLALGKDEETRRAAYRDLVQEAMSAETLEAIRACLRSGQLLADKRPEPEQPNVTTLTRV